MAKLTHDTFLKKSKLKHPGLFSYQDCMFTSIKQPVIISCVVHGSFSVLPQHHLQFDGGGCPECNIVTNKIIVLDHKHCQYITSDIKLFKKVKKYLSFKTLGVEYTQAYRNGWNGITYLMDNKGRFLSGLLDYVKEYFELHKISFEVEDRSKDIAVETSLDIGPKLESMKIVPRDYQLQIVDAAIKNKKGIVRACTGSGKSICTALLTAKLNKPTIIYVIGIDLLQQFHDLFSKLFDEPIGMIGNGVCDVQRINIATIWTIGRSLKVKPKSIINDDVDKETDPSATQSEKILKMLHESRVHIIDESHVITTETIKHILSQINPEHIFGFSGTPFRDDNTDLLIKGILGEQIINVNASRLIDRGILAQPVIKFVPVPAVSMPMAQYQTVYKSYIVDNDIRNKLIINELVKLLDKKYKPLVLFKQIKHGKILADMMTEEGINFAMLHGNDSLERRMEVKEMIQNGEIDVILASTIFDIGVDLPILNALILSGGGKSSIRALQRIGRVIRSYPGKKHAAIVDFYDQVKFLKKHSKHRYKVYKSERGFKFINLKAVPDLLK